MSRTALLAITEPAKILPSAQSDLAQTSAQCAAWAVTQIAAWSTLFSMLSVITARASSLLARAVTGTATEDDIAALINAERVLAAAMHLLHEQASRTTRLERLRAMQAATAVRVAHAAILLTRREAVASLYTGLAWSVLPTSPPIRILPGAEPAIEQLGWDAQVYGQQWDVLALAERLGRFVVTQP
jgi:hypothetical protein